LLKNKKAKNPKLNELSKIERNRLAKLDGRPEPLLKCINVVFFVVYGFGIARYFWLYSL